MASAIVGSVSEFDEKIDSFSDYIERLEQFFIANDIETSVKKRAVLLSCIGARTYKLLSNLLSPARPAECDYAAIVNTLTEHHNPRPSTIVQRFKFNSRTRFSGESVRTFTSELKKLSEFCEYGDSLEEMLRDRIVCGINNTKVQQRLLSEKDLTYKKTVEIAQAMEAATEGVNDLNGASVGVNVVKSKFKSDTSKSGTACYRCGGSHVASECQFRDKKCFKCQKTGHVAKMCKQKKKTSSKFHKTVVGQVDSDTVSNLFTVSASVPPIVQELVVNGKCVQFHVDTGAALTVMGDDTYKRLFKEPLQKCSISLRTYTGEKLKVVGQTEVKVTQGSQCKALMLVVVTGKGPSLLGRDWLKHLHVDWSVFSVNTPASTSELERLLDDHADVFSSSAGCLQGVAVKLHLRPEATPKFCKARQPPYALRDSIEEELSRLQRDGIIEPVEFSEWATPIVPVKKKDGTVRICGDYKTTLNKATHNDKYPIPRIEDLAYALSGGEKFSKIDFSHAYTQLQLDDASKDLTTINTHKGLFRYQRLCFGVASAPGIFQRTLESVFRDVPNCVNYLDDLYVTGKDDAEHLENLQKVLSICKAKGLSLRKEKCEFLKQEVTFLGYRLDKSGIQPMNDKVQAIR